MPRQFVSADELVAVAGDGYRFNLARSTGNTEHGAYLPTAGWSYYFP